ncbi:MAG TPA: cupredoxin family copper-binding protein [Candidatus Eisenbacteria bacterium]|nr:cupredoxin family copper-binding protein [Candidatus Eisenbacteria bacterium]
MHLVRAGFALAGGLTLAACGGGTTPATNAPAAGSPGASVGATACARSDTAGTIEVEIEDLTFKTEPVQAKVGDTISWTNKDDVPHSAALDDGSCATDTLNKGDAGNLTFSAPGTYAYHCAIHPTQMKGTIVVSG